MKLNFLDDVVKKLCDALPPNLQNLKTDAEKNFHTILQSTFAKLDLVTREEFDAQTKVLLRSRKKIDELSEKLADLEKRLKGKG